MQPSRVHFVTGGWFLFSVRVGDELVEVATIHWFDDALEVEWISTASTPELCATLSALLVRGIEGRYGMGQRPVNVVVWDEGRVVPLTEGGIRARTDPETHPFRARGSHGARRALRSPTEADRRSNRSRTAPGE